MSQLTSSFYTFADVYLLASVCVVSGVVIVTAIDRLVQTLCYWHVDAMQKAL